MQGDSTILLECWSLSCFQDQQQWIQWVFCPSVGRVHYDFMYISVIWAYLSLLQTVNICLLSSDWLPRRYILMFHAEIFTFHIWQPAHVKWSCPNKMSRTWASYSGNRWLAFQKWNLDRRARNVLGRTIWGHCRRHTTTAQRLQHQSAILHHNHRQFVGNMTRMMITAVGWEVVYIVVNP